MKPVDELVKAANSVEFLMWSHMGKMGAAYQQLTNSTSAAEGNEAIKEFRTAAKDLEKAIREILYRWQVPSVYILNLNKRALMMWTLDDFSGLWTNANHYLQRFVHAAGETPEEKQASKARELTTFYFLIRDLADCSLEVKPESYRNNGLQILG